MISEYICTSASVCVPVLVCVWVCLWVVCLPIGVCVCVSFCGQALAAVPTIITMRKSLSAIVFQIFINPETEIMGQVSLGPSSFQFLSMEKWAKYHLAHPPFSFWVWKNGPSWFGPFSFYLRTMQKWAKLIWPSMEVLVGCTNGPSDLAHFSIDYYKILGHVCEKNFHQYFRHHLKFHFSQ